jgi:hypothetical protein
LLEEIVDRFGKLPPAGANLDGRSSPARFKRALWRGESLYAAPGVIVISFKPNPLH